MFNTFCIFVSQEFQRMGEISQTCLYGMPFLCTSVQKRATYIWISKACCKCTLLLNFLILVSFIIMIVVILINVILIIVMIIINVVSISIHIMFLVYINSILIIILFLFLLACVLLSLVSCKLSLRNTFPIRFVQAFRQKHLFITHRPVWVQHGRLFMASCLAGMCRWQRLRDPVDEAADAKSLRPDQLMVCKSAVQRVSVSGVRCQHVLKFL